MENIELEKACNRRNNYARKEKKLEELKLKIETLDRIENVCDLLIYTEELPDDQEVNELIDTVIGELYQVYELLMDQIEGVE